MINNTASLVQACRRILAAIAIAAPLLTFACPAHAQVVAVVNGSPITNLDIEQRSKLISAGTHKAPSRQDVLQELIDEKIKIAVAKTYTLEVSDAEVENAFAEMARRGHMSIEQMTAQLNATGAGPGTLKARLRAEIAWTQLVRGRYSASLQVNDSDIAKALPGDQKQVGYVYTLRPIVFVIPRGSSEGEIEAARREAENLRGRFQSCADGIILARSLRNVAVRDPITKSSVDLGEALQQLLSSMQIGQLTTPEMTQQGLQMFALCGKRESVEDNPMKRQVREQIFAKRYEAQAKKFLEDERKRAMIEYR
jgi:peptidyl-prolyl cis-trans isomerase SurA